MREGKWKIYPKVSDDLVLQLLKNRNLHSEKEVKEFLEPPEPKFLLKNLSSLSSDFKDQLLDAAAVLRQAVKARRPVVVYGDYDVDGLCATAILWETLYRRLNYRNVSPFIPSRFSGGYGLSRESLDKIAGESAGRKPPLLITVDCGITAPEAVEYAHSLGMEIIVTDHHQPPPAKEMERLRKAATAIVWTDKICAAAIAWLLAATLLKPAVAETLELAALATIADLQPLLGPNRSLARFGLKKLSSTKRVGLRALIKEAGLENKAVGAYEAGWLLAPRLNSAGRLETALEALRLLCTENRAQASRLAKELGVLNSERQRVLGKALDHARSRVSTAKLDKITIAAHESYHEGVVGLVASRLVQEFYRPSLVISKGEELSKGSARSIKGFNIVAALRRLEHLFEDVGGHPMAAGFTIKTKKIELLREELERVAKEDLDEAVLSPAVEIDAEISLSQLDFSLWQKLEKLEPHGIGNPRPLFLTKGVSVLAAQTVGGGGAHLKLLVTGGTPPETGNQFSAIFFNHGHLLKEISPGEKIDLVYSLAENTWNGKRSLELKARDLRKG